MNTSDANKFISAINRIVEGYTALAAAIEEAAWEGIEDHAGMPGIRPIAAAQLAQPLFEAEAEEYEAAHQQAAKSEAMPKPEPQTEPDPDPVTLEQVRAFLATASQAGHTEQVRALIQQAGVDRLSEVDPSKYGWMKAQAEALTDA